MRVFFGQYELSIDQYNLDLSFIYLYLLKADVYYLAKKELISQFLIKGYLLVVYMKVSIEMSG
jgi:hypothetical protein